MQTHHYIIIFSFTSSNHPSTPSLLVTNSLLSVSVSLFLFWKRARKLCGRIPRQAVLEGGPPNKPPSPCRSQQSWDLEAWLIGGQDLDLLGDGFMEGEPFTLTWVKLNYFPVRVVAIDPLSVLQVVYTFFIF